MAGTNRCTSVLEGCTPNAVLHCENTSERRGSLRGEATDQALRTRPNAFVIPDQRSTEDQLNRSIGHDESLVHASTPTSSKVRERSTRLLASPNGAANVRVRRTNPGKALLQSPARLGYTSRMRQIFEDATHGQSEPHINHGLLYPQLPNISRTAAPAISRLPKTDNVRLPNGSEISQDYRLESLCLPTKVLSVVAPPERASTDNQRTSQCSPGSWSDDSGYIITHARDRDRILAIPLNERIYDWLSEITNEDCETSISRGEGGERRWNSAAVEPSHEECDVFRDVSKTNCAELSSEPAARAHAKLPMAEAWPALENPFGSDANKGGSLNAPPMARREHFKMPDGLVADETCPACAKLIERSANFPSGHEHIISTMQDSVHEVDGTKDDGMQLSPLSPNVCIERGPSRYRLNRSFCDDDIIATPNRVHPASHFRSPQLKENVIMQVPKPGNDHSPLASRSSRIGTRFRPQH